MTDDWRLSRGRKPEACKQCPAFLEGNGFVPGDGPYDSKIIFVGRGPANAEAVAGRPYAGGAGRLYDSILYRAGLKRREVYTTNLVKCAFKDRDPRTEEIAYCAATYLKQELADRKVIVSMGSLPCQTLTGNASVKRERGQVHRLVQPLESSIRLPTPVLVTFEPAGLLWSRSEALNKGKSVEQRDMLPVVIKDFVKGKRIAQGGSRFSQSDVFITNPTSEQLNTIVDKAEEEGKFALDIETSYHEDKKGDRITMIGLSLGRDHAATMTNWEQHRATLQKLFSMSDVMMTVFNAQFDPPKLIKDGGFDVRNRVYDAMLASHLVESDMGDFGLEAVCSRHVDRPTWKHLKTTDPRRNLIDCAATAELEAVLTPSMRQLGVEDLFWKHQMPLSPICAGMRDRGIKVDEMQMMKTSLALKRILKRYEDDLVAGIKIPWFNWKSPVQLKELLYGIMKLPTQYHRRNKSKVTTDRYALEDLQRIRPTKVVELITKMREIEKLGGSFMSGKYVHEDGRVHPSIKQHGTVTGRFSYVQPNMQQIRKGMARSMFVADTDEHIFVERDFSQIELRLMAWLSRCDKLLRMFNAGVDVHVENAKRFYSEATVNATQRSLAKNMIYGIMYGQGAGGLGMMYGVEEAYAQRYIDYIFSEYPELKQWRNGLLNTIDERNFLRNPYGRIRWLWNKSFATQAYICLPQGTAADVIFESMIELEDALPAGATMAVQCHDSLLVHCHGDQRDEVSRIMEEVMQRPRDVLGGMSFPTKGGAGYSYDEASKEEGLIGDWRKLRRRRFGAD
jgi:uracil-DNA glycosylase family 4